MNYNKEWYRKLTDRVITDYKMYKNIKIESIEKHKMYKEIYNSVHYLIVTIKNKNIILKKPYKNIFDTELRIKSIHTFLIKMIKYIDKNNLPSIDGIYIFKITDSYEYRYEFPIISYAKPHNKKGFLYPDFNLNQLEEKQKMFKKRCDNIKKEHKIFFKGSRTTKDSTKVREKLQLKSNDILKIDLSKKYIPYYCLCKYKYVLDLPGFRPWSVRLIELYLSKSLPIRIIQYYKKWGEDRWIQFYENMFPSLYSYIPIKIDSNYTIELSQNTIDTIYNKIIKIYKYMENKNKVYDKIVNNNYKKASSLKEEHILYYLYIMMFHYNKIVIG